jgi:hypothetical protein
LVQIEGEVEALRVVVATSIFDGESIASEHSTSRRAFLSSLVSSAGALADNSSADISSKYRSGHVPEGPGVSPAAMKTWRSGVPRLESVVTTSVGVCSSAGASGVPSWKGSESR